MQATNQSVAPSEPSRANGHTQLHDLFVLTDEQIFEIEPEAQDVTVSGDVAQGDGPAGVSPRSEAASQRRGTGRKAHRQDCPCYPNRPRGWPRR